MTRNMVIKWLRWIQNMFDPMSEQYKALQFAIDSLEVDEAYQLEYEKTTDNKIVVENTEENKMLKNRCRALTGGVMCVYCPYDCDNRTQEYDPSSLPKENE